MSQIRWTLGKIKAIADARRVVSGVLRAQLQTKAQTMKIIRQAIPALAICAAAVVASSAHAVVSINFDSLNDGSSVDGYYDGGFASDGTGPGPNYGVTFSNATVLNEFSENEGLLITPPNSITFVSGTGSILDDAAGFTTGFSFDYSSSFFLGTVDVYSGLDGTGTLLAAISLPETSNGSSTPGCMGHNYCPDVPAGVTFAGTAESVNFSGTADYIVYDDITIGSAAPITSGTPEPTTWVMMLLGVAGIGSVVRRRARAGTTVTA